MRVAFDGQWLPIFPVGPDKKPLCKHGYYDSETDYRPWPCGALPAVPTGAASGLDVLDIDVPIGRAWLEAHGARLPPTRVHSTQRGGFHYLFRSAPGLRCSISRIAPGVDIRSNGGYVTWWPAAGLVVQDVTVAEWPEWLLSLVRIEKRPYPVVTFETLTRNGVLDPATVTTGFVKPPVPPTLLEKNWSERAVQNTFARVSNAPHGARNYTLNAEAYALGRLVARGWLSSVRVERALTLAAERAGLGVEETRKTIASGMRAGMRAPYGEITRTLETAG